MAQVEKAIVTPCAMAPMEVEVDTGDTIRWTNLTALTASLIFPPGLVSPPDVEALEPNGSVSKTVIAQNPGRYEYDLICLHPAEAVPKPKIIVKKPGGMV